MPILGELLSSIFPRRLNSHIKCVLFNDSVKMDVVATVKILKNNFDEWLSFFKIYEHLRNGFATNEVAYKYSKLDLWFF